MASRHRIVRAIVDTIRPVHRREEEPRAVKFARFTGPLLFSSSFLQGLSLLIRTPVTIRQIKSLARLSQKEHLRTR